MSDLPFDAQAYLDRLPEEVRPAYRAIMDAEEALRAAKKDLSEALREWSRIVREREARCHS